MPVPTAYTESELADYMYAAMGDTAQVIGWTGSGALAGAVIEALIAYGVTSIDVATDIPRLRALALVEAWKAAMAQVSGDYKFTDIDGRTAERQQIFDHCQEMLAQATADAANYPGPTLAYSGSAIGRIALDLPRSLQPRGPRCAR